MAGLHSCFRTNFINNILKNGILWQSFRGKHFLATKISAVKNVRILVKSNSNYTNVYRLASTNTFSTEVINLKEQSPKPEVNSSVNTNVGDGLETLPNSSSVGGFDESLPPIPLPPTPSADEILTVIDLGLKEPSFTSLGLGSYWPPGLLQYLFEYLHINWDLPWYGAIFAVTMVIRLLMFPLVIKGQKNSVIMHNNLPQYQKLINKMTEARHTGNYYEAALATQELQIFAKEKKLFGFSTFLPPLIQAPVFLSMYLCLKGLAQAPVESMKTGGLFWFENLVIPDPYYILPLYSALTLYAVIEISTRDQRMMSGQQVWLFTALKVLPLIIIPFTINMSSAVLYYWSVTNTISVGQVMFLKIPFVKKLFKLPEKINHDPELLPKKKLGTIQNIKETMANMKIAQEINERERLSAVTFEKAGVGPVPRTFKRDPTKRLPKETK